MKGGVDPVGSRRVTTRPASQDPSARALPDAAGPAPRHAASATPAVETPAAASWRGIVRGEALSVAALFLVSAATRLLTRSRVPYHWDSVNFCLALEHYDIAAHQPHPPGYVLYVLMGRAMNALVGDANDSLVLISILASGLACAIAYLLGRDMFDRPTGLYATALAATGPLFWFYGSVALSYIVEFALTGLIGWCCYHGLAGRRGFLFAASIALGIAGGVRQNTLPLMLPLWLYCVAQADPRERLGGVLGLVLPTLAWIAAMLGLSGGLDAYLWAVAGQAFDAAAVSDLGSGMALLVNLARLTVYAVYALTLGVAVIPLLLPAWLRGLRRHLRQPHWQVLGLWLLPSLAFYALFVQQAGYTFTFMMALIVVVARGLRYLAGRVWGTAPRQLALGLVLACNLLFFLAAPPFLFGWRRQLFNAPSLPAIRERDRTVQERVAYIRGRFPPEASVIVAGPFDFRLPDYYLRDYARLNAVQAAGNGVTAMPLEDGVAYVVLFDDWLSPAPGGERPREITLPSGASVRWFERGTAQEVVLADTSVGLEPVRSPGP